MIELRQVDGGVTIPIKARPGSRRNALAGVHAGAVRVTLTAAPEGGKANAALLMLLAEALDVRRGDLAILRGQTSTDKVVLVRGAALADIRQRLLNALATD